jgi:hypothetical protein
MTSRLIRHAFGIGGLAVVLPHLALGQDAAALEARAKARFQRFDGNASGWLSGRELEACACRAYDRNGDSEVTWAEFYRGELQAAVAQMQRDAGLPASDDDAPAVAARPAAPAPQNAQGAYRVGDRVAWNLGGIEFAGTIYAANGGRYRIDRDGYGRASEWVPTTDLRRLPQAAAAAAAPAAASRYGPGDRVEVYAEGGWRAATGSRASNGRYWLVRDDRAYGVSSSETPVGEDVLRPLVTRPTPAAPPNGALPQSVPLGGYTCTTYQTGGGSRVGLLRILSASVSSGVTPDGSGPQHRFAYDAATGSIAWPGGLQIVGFTVERAEYRPTTDGRPNINLHYRARPGGNLNSMSCMREGA